jgi:thiol peroxidase
MATQRKGLLKFAGQDVTIVGNDITVGQKAPEFTAQAQDWSVFHGLGNTRGKVRIIGSLPSINTSVCDRETRRFNQEAAALGENLAILMVSMDLPYTLKNWCAAAGVDKVITLSDHISVEFGEKYGVLILENRIFRRAIFVVDQNDEVIYAAYMPALGEEPKYDEVLAAAKKAIG